MQFPLLSSPRSQTFCCSSRWRNIFQFRPWRVIARPSHPSSSITLPELQDSFILRDLIHSFELECSRHPVGPPSWDLVKVLDFLCRSVFEPLSSRPLRIVTMNVSFLLTLGELQALSSNITFRGPDHLLKYFPEFMAKTESERNPLPRSFLVKPLLEFVGDFSEERLLCPVHAVRIYIDLTSSLSPRPRLLFVSPRGPSRPLSKKSLPFFIHQVILDAGIMSEGASFPHAYSVRGVTTSAAFLRNWSVSKVWEAATWRSNPVFAVFRYRDLSYSLDNCHSLGPFVAADSVVG